MGFQLPAYKNATLHIFRHLETANFNYLYIPTLKTIFHFVQISWVHWWPQKSAVEILHVYMWSLPRMISSNIAQLSFWPPLQIGANLKDPIQTNQQRDTLNCIRWKIMIMREIFDWKFRCSQATLVRTTGTLSWSQRCTAHFFRACSRSQTAPGVPMMQDAPAFTPHLDVPRTFNSYYSKCFLFRSFFTYHFPWPKAQEHVHHKNHSIETLLTYFLFFWKKQFPNRFLNRWIHRCNSKGLVCLHVFGWPAKSDALSDSPS